jgi:SAM-dependent MidA family methyltransferase
MRIRKFCLNRQRTIGPVVFEFGAQNIHFRAGAAIVKRNVVAGRMQSRCDRCADAFCGAGNYCDWTRLNGIFHGFAMRSGMLRILCDHRFFHTVRMQVELPEPSADERAHSEHLATLIRSEILAANGALDFARYMELALYAPGLGYYSAGATKFGRAGDFTTAPEMGFLFARCLARAVAPTLREIHGDILEIGPGSGALAAELLLELERLNALPKRYRLLESSADLRERQRATLSQRCAHLEKYTEWLDSPASESWRGVLIANEVIDALPARLFALRESGVFTRAVGIGERGEFVWCERLADAKLIETVTDAVADVETLPRPYCSEIRPMLAPWFAAVTRSLQQGMALFIDYGYSAAEYYAPQRTQGTLLCHFRHRAHDNPLILAGLQDITAWVDFDALASAGAAANFEVYAHSRQADFLIENGLQEVFANAHEQAADEAERYRLAQEVKRLTLPGQMGDAFRVMGLVRRPAEFSSR